MEQSPTHSSEIVNAADALVSDFPPPEVQSNTFLPFKLPSRQDFVMAALANNTNDNNAILPFAVAQTLDPLPFLQLQSIYLQSWITSHPPPSSWQDSHTIEPAVMKSPLSQSTCSFSCSSAVTSLTTPFEMC